eukprot:12035317-Ditylum_brightwellii.AAC.1
MYNSYKNIPSVLQLLTGNSARNNVGEDFFQWQIAPILLANSPPACWRCVGMRVAKIIYTMPALWHIKKRERSMH